MAFEYVEIKGKGCEGWINLFFEGYCIAMISDTDLADRIKAVSTKARSSSEVAGDTCPVCLGEGFSPIGGRLGAPCGLCGDTGKLTS